MDADDPTTLVDRVFGDRYRIVGSVGISAVAEVFVADDLIELRRVAIKVFDQVIGEDPDLADRVIARVRTAAQIDHPSVVAIRDWGLDGVRLWVVSDLCDGGSLRSMLERGRRLTPSQALVMSLELARALAHAHDHGLVHGAVKPENVLFSADQRLRVSDFGLTDVLADAPLARPAAALDQVRYASPEQAAGRPVSEATDLYSLALVANEAVSGEAPIVSETVVGTMMARADAVASLSQDLADLRGPLERAGRLDPADRPEAEELTIGLLAAAETMSRPGPLPLVGLPGFARPGAPTAEVASSNAPVEASGPASAVAESGTDGIASPDGPGSALASADEPRTVPDSAALWLDRQPSPSTDDGSAERAALVAVPDVDEAAPRVGLEDLAHAEPTFATEATETSVLDVPAAAASNARGVFRPDAEDLDDQLPVWPLVVLAALVAALVAALWLFAIGPSDGANAPLMVGLDEQELAAAVADGGWHIERLEARRNGTVAGTVISQQPEPGMSMSDGEPLRVTISLGAEMVEIPDDLPGLTLEQARDRLRIAGLEVGVVTREPSESLEADLVIGLDEPTRQKPQGEAVSLRVSTGAADRVVPDTLVGTTIADATAQLAGLRLQGLEEQIYDPVAEPGTVLATLPAAGEVVPADSQVTLLVSAGPEPVEMPDLAELSLAEAVDALEALGLIFADTQGTPGEPVIATIPAAGEIVDVGAEITIVLADPAEDDEDGDEAEDG